MVRERRYHRIVVLGGTDRAHGAHLDRRHNVILGLGGHDSRGMICWCLHTGIMSRRIDRVLESVGVGRIANYGLVRCLNHPRRRLSVECRRIL